jgi:hypothetical protein
MDEISSSLLSSAASHTGAFFLGHTTVVCHVHSPYTLIHLSHFPYNLVKSSTMLLTNTTKIMRTVVYV